MKNSKKVTVEVDARVLKNLGAAAAALSSLANAVVQGCDNARPRTTAAR
jgi:hypothetical protein